MLFRIHILIFVFCAFSFCSCSKEGTEITYVHILPESSETVIESGYESFVYFSIDTTIYNPRLDPALSGPSIKLEQAGHSTCQHLVMECIIHVDRSGERIYEALIKSNVVTSSYSDKCYLMVLGSDGKEHRSNEFVVNCNIIDEKTLPKSGLPVVRVQASEVVESFSKTEYKECLVHLYDKEGKLLNESTCSVKLRGQSSLQYPKHSFLLKFPEKISVFDLPEHKRWVLCASFIDRTMIRNEVSYYIASKTSLRYTPRYVNCELVFNGKHVGNYLLIEQIRVGKKRLDISEEAGFLFECDSHLDDDNIWFVPFGHYRGDGGGQHEPGTPFVIKYPADDDISQEQTEEAKQFVYDTFSSLFSDDFLDGAAGYRKNFDLQSFADYWIVNEVAMNVEPTNPNSVFMYKDVSPVMYAGPVWDFDFGTYSYYSRPDDFKDFAMKNSAIYERMMSDPVFRSVLKERWMALKPFLETEVPQYIENKREYLRKSAELNFAIWNPADDKIYHYGYLINGDEEMTYDEAIDLMIQNYKKHMATMDSIISQW